MLNGINLLNLGCGQEIFEGWVNADFFKGFIPWRKYTWKPDWMLDLRYPLRCDDNLFDGVFCEHTIEHLYPQEVSQLLRETLRVMKPGAWLRISVPDLEKYVNFYAGEGTLENFTSRWATGCEAIRSLTQNWLHYSVWDYTLLERFLREAGFSQIRKVGFMEGSDAHLLRDSEERRWESLYMEAQKKI
ncbi:MAG: methyltransferase domain-containing protein [Candidatus Omnitrophota bacterium]